MAERIELKMKMSGRPPSCKKKQGPMTMKHLMTYYVISITHKFECIEID
jgi:hypothetical protein